MPFAPKHVALLQAMLESLFGDNELRTLAIHAFPDNPSIHASLPGSGASLTELTGSLVLLMTRHYDRLPASFWSYLHRKRRSRGLEIEQVRRLFDPPLEEPGESPATEPACESDAAVTHSVVRLGGGTRGRCDLLEVLAILPGSSPRMSPHASFIQRHFPELRRGRVNGLDRSFILNWSEVSLNLAVTPSLCSERRLGPRNLSVPLPVSGLAHEYYPCGSSHVLAGATRPLSYRFTIDEWTSRARRVSFADAADRRLTFEFE